MKPSVLVISSDPVAIEFFSSAFNPDFTVLIAGDAGDRRKYLIDTFPIELILLDLTTAGVDAPELFEQLKQSGAKSESQIIFAVGEDGSLADKLYLQAGAPYRVIGTMHSSALAPRNCNPIDLVMAVRRVENKPDHPEQTVVERLGEINRSESATLLALSSVIALKASETAAHSHQIQRILWEFLKELASSSEFSAQLDERYFEILCESASLHDIGKIGIPDAILNKPGRLTVEERRIMQTHTTIGFDLLQNVEAILGKSSLFTIAQEIALTHHEKWDGSGYPNGQIGQSIPLAGRIVAVVDVYEALISERIYKRALSHHEAMEIIVDGSGSHFDPDLVKALCRIERQIEAVAREAA